jgi:hypothetical protein
MALEQYASLNSVVLTNTASSVTFSSIPQEYRDVILMAQCKSVSSPTDAYILFNGDSGANYTRVRISGTGSATSPGTVTGDTRGYIDSYGYVTASFGHGVTVQVMDYSATDKHKVYLSRSNNSTDGVDVLSGRWASTAGISSITILVNTESFAAGSTFSLYGVR